MLVKAARNGHLLVLYSSLELINENRSIGGIEIIDLAT